ncbi:uncharacterized protein FFFS_08715 [Fusarium fujikuroi]|nr:uncharacterized protein FFFS_08715 [Fusarium fujikuroi]
MSSTSANIPAWQQKIRAKVAALSAPTLGTMSMSSLKATESAQLAAPIATDDAIEVINRLPEAQQDGAADFFIDGMDIIANTVDQVSSDLGAIGTRYLSDFLKGDWSGLTKVDNNLKAACDGAIHGVNSIKR